MSNTAPSNSHAADQSVYDNVPQQENKAQPVPPVREEPKPQPQPEQQKPAAPKVEQPKQPQPHSNTWSEPVKEESQISFDLEPPAPSVPPRNLAAAQTGPRKTDPTDPAQNILARMRNRQRSQEQPPRDDYDPTENPF